MSRFIDADELLTKTGIKLPPQIAQTGYFDIDDLPVGKPNTMLSGYAGTMRPLIVLLLIEDGDDWKYYDIELICLPKIAELSLSNINYYVSQKLPECSCKAIGYLLLDELMAKAPEMDMLSPLNLKSDLPLEDAMTGLCWIQVQTEEDLHPQLCVANLVVSIMHRDKTFSVNGIVYDGCKEVRIAELKSHQANGVPMTYLPILKSHLL